MKVLVTGAGGMLGVDVCDALRARGHTVTPTGRTLRDDIRSLDVTDTRQVRTVLEAERPDVIIHCAAWTDVDGAERDPDGAYRGNALGAWNVGDGAGRVGAWMVYVSTDFVFDGAKGAPYTEFDRTNPLGVYGASKEAGEQLVRQTLPDRHLIVRTAWLFGRHGRCFPKTILRLAETKPEIPVVADQIGCPTHTVDLARKVVDLLADPLPGTYHVVSGGQCSWFEFAQAILQQAGLSTRVVPITAAEYAARFQSPTRRPPYSVLRRLALEMRGMDDLPNWQDALMVYLNR
jgi:dTDP-4-dehydrorhamnose reductase